MSGTSKVLAAIACCAGVLIGSSAFAAPLNGHPDAYLGISGSSAYSNGTLSGMIDYAVFTKAKYIANFGTLEDLPSGTVTISDPLVYAYQVFNGGSSVPVAAEFVGLPGPANEIGYFSDLGDVKPSSMSLGGTSAAWFFNSPEIQPGESSYGLAITSPNLPVPSISLTIDGGMQAVAMVVAPGAEAIPEPSSLMLLVSGLTVVAFLRRRRG